MADDGTIKAPKVKNITSEYTFLHFDSLLLIDAGSDGFKVKDSRGVSSSIPTGVPISIAGQAGMASGPFTIEVPDAGSLNVTAIYYD
jgi:hypothetical protein